MKLVFQKNQKKNLWKILFLIFTLTVGIGSFLKVYKNSLHLYMTPEDIKLHPPSGLVRVGGDLKQHSLAYRPEHIEFTISDSKGYEVPVVFYGTPPRLLKERQEVIVMGTWSAQDSIFEAQEVLAKHDEYYSPKNKSVEPT